MSTFTWLQHEFRRATRFLSLAAAMLMGAALNTTAPTPAQAGGPQDSGAAAGLTEFGQGRFAEALQDWQQAADAGSATAAFYLGVAYDTGQGVHPSPAQALDWYRRAGDSGSVPAQFNVGIFYDSGRGVVADHAEAARWYERAASQGFARAEYNLGLLYEAGDGVPVDHRRAATLFRAAAGQGLEAARMHLGHASAGPSHPTPDLATLDFQRAQRVLLTRGPAEIAQVAGLFHQSAVRHNPMAEYDYGYCLENGLGVPQDKAMAYSWYGRAASDAKEPALRTMAQGVAGALQQQLSSAQIRTAQRQLDETP